MSSQQQQPSAMPVSVYHGPNSNSSPPKTPGRFGRKQVHITAVEDEDMGYGTIIDLDDEIPGPPPERQQVPLRRETSQSRSRGLFLRVSNLGRSNNNKDHGNSSDHIPRIPGLNGSRNGGGLLHKRNKTMSDLGGSKNNKSNGPVFSTSNDEMNGTRSGSRELLELREDPLQISLTEHVKWSGGGILANRADLELPPEEFAAGCNLLQSAARGDWGTMQQLLDSHKTNVNFRDYDRRTALHVAASEGHLDVCRKLVEAGAKVNRSDRWGGSPLDDAHRHRHTEIVKYLRQQNASTGSGNRATNLIKAAADGDYDEVQMLLNLSVHHGQQRSTKPAGSIAADLSIKKKVYFDVNQSDYDKRTALHLAAGEGHTDIVRILVQAGANVNAEDRWHRRPLDDATDGEHTECIKVLKEFGALAGENSITSAAAKNSLKKNGSSLLTDDSLTSSSRVRMQDDNMRVEFEELEMIDRIGQGAFGEIYKCRWRGTLVATKIIKSAKIRREWVNRRMMEEIQKGTKDIDEAVKEMDNAEFEEKEKDMALADFRQEISVLRSLRHPHIVLLLAYSTTENYECLISELMKCSLLDVFKSHMVQGTRMRPKTQIIYATQLSRGMQYLHSCKPPIIHRDLKPANLLIDPSGVLKISDFGLSKVRPNPGQNEKETFTMTGETGSYRFMAPEVFRHEEYNETVDVYSYGMIFFYLAAGRPPWPTLPGLEAVKRASETGDRPTIPRDMDARLQNLLKECWDDSPSVRPPFTVITKILTAYSRDVFKESEDAVVVAPATDSGCSCTIL